MSNLSIVISEHNILEVMDEMCAQSLDPETHDAWLKVKEQLISNRKSLQEIAEAEGK